MPILDFEDSQAKKPASKKPNPAPKSRKKLRVILGIGALAAVTGIGSTLAANISLNGGGNVEFGQGDATTAACDDSITLTPVSTFSNTEEDPTFAMTSIQVSGVYLAPEGWDIYAQAWMQGFNWETHTWDPGYEEHIGQSYNSETNQWTNTCENKVLMLHAYTNNYPERTVLNDVASPLYLTGGVGRRGHNNDGSTNSGVAFRMKYITTQFGSYWDFDFGGENLRWEPLWRWDYSFTGNQEVKVIIDLNGNDYYPPSDSRWVDKLTVESAVDLPSTWNWAL